jgi:hypothetical protein
MTGRYRVYLPLDSTMQRGFRKDRASRFDDCWSRFVALCVSLDREGLNYDVQFNFAPSAEQCSDAVPGPYALVTAEGTPKPRVQRRAKVTILPPMPAVEQVQKRLITARQAVVPSPGPCWNHGQEEWRQVRKRQHVIGRVIARMKAQGRATLNDSDIRRIKTATRGWIALTPEGLLAAGKREHKVFRPYQPPQPAARLARLADFAEYTYWREMARLLAERRAA